MYVCAVPPIFPKIDRQVYRQRCTYRDICRHWFLSSQNCMQSDNYIDVCLHSKLDFMNAPYHSADAT